MFILQQSYKSMRDAYIKNLSINVIRAIKHFSGMEPQTIGSYEKFLLNFVSLPTARKLIADMIESGFVVVSNDSQDKRKKLLELHEFDYEKFL